MVCKSVCHKRSYALWRMSELWPVAGRRERPKVLWKLREEKATLKAPPQGRFKTVYAVKMCHMPYVWTWNSSHTSGEEGSVYAIQKSYWFICNVFYYAHVSKQLGTCFLTTKEEAVEVYEDLTKMLKILQKWFSQMQVVADLVASRTTILSTTLGSLGKQESRWRSCGDTSSCIYEKIFSFSSLNLRSDLSLR